MGGKKMKTRFMRLVAFIMVVLLISVGCKKQENIPETQGTLGNDTVETSDTVSRENGDRYHGDLRISTDLVSTSMDPHLTNGLMANFQWVQHVYETPLVTSDTGEIYPLLCDYEYSEDGLTLKLTMLPNRYFSDGTPVTIEDVVASIDRVGKYHTTFKEVFIDLIVDTKIEDDSVTYTFSKYNSNALYLLSDIRGPVFVMQKSLIDQLGEDGQVADISQVVGSGCYKLTKYNPDTEIVLTKNELYVPLETDGTGPAAPRYGYCDTITFCVNVDSTSRTAGLIAGDYHFGSIISDMQSEAEKVGLKRYYIQNGWTPAIFFNLHESNSDSPVYDKNFRKAIRAALDMEAIMLSVTGNDEERIILNPSPVPKNSIYYNDIIATTEWNIFDKELAKEYLEKSNYNGETIYWLCSQSASFYKAAVVGEQMLKDIGINVELMLVDSGSHSAMRIDPTTGHDIGAWETQKEIIPTDQTSFVIGTAGGWWDNEKKTELLEIMYNSKVGSQESIEAYEEFCKLVVEEVPWIAFGELLTVRYGVPELKLNYEGAFAYYWNSYFEK